MKINQGDIVIIPVPFTDNLGYKMRPAVVISNKPVHATGDAVIVQITSKQKNDGLGIEIKPDDIGIDLPAKSYIRFHKIFVLEIKLIKGVVASLNQHAYNNLAQKIFDMIHKS
jgi:mRNA interferase MazF